MSKISSFASNITISQKYIQKFWTKFVITDSPVFLGGCDMRKFVYATALVVLCLGLILVPAAAHDENATDTIQVTDDRARR
jgi:hypothetical protein